MTFHQPSVWLLVALLVLPVLWWRQARSRAALPFSHTMPLSRVRPGLAVRLRWIMPLLRMTALALLIIGLARPQKSNERSTVMTEGVAIQLIIDRSGSMEAMDFVLDNQRVNRLDAVKDVVEKFVTGGDGLPGRPDDLIGLIAFSTFADSACPLTLDHDHLIEAVRQVRVPAEEQNRATAIGDAIALGVERIGSLERRADLRQRQRIKSRVIILLTDGENTAGDIDPLTAAAMAEAFDIRVYTIGAGTERGVAPMPFEDPFTGRTVYRQVPVSIDEQTLKAVAGRTGGQYFRATDSDSLRDIYGIIDQLERTEIEQRRFVDSRELAVQSIPLNGIDLPPVLLMALLVLAFEVALSSTRLQILP